MKIKFVLNRFCLKINSSSSANGGGGVVGAAVLETHLESHLETGVRLVQPTGESSTVMDATATSQSPLPLDSSGCGTKSSNAARAISIPRSMEPDQTHETVEPKQPVGVSSHLDPKPVTVGLVSSANASSQCLSSTKIASLVPRAVVVKVGETITIQASFSEKSVSYCS